MRRITLGQTLILATALVVAGPACGQLPSQDSEDTLEEVLVTAQRRSQPVQTVPISMSAFAGDHLERMGAGTVEDVARMAPDFTIGHGSQQTNSIMSIRGIGSVGNSAIESSVGVFIDGVYYPRAGSVIGLLSDVQTFEVLRGPQGTLFGRNAVAGALNITTRDPSRDAGGVVEVGYGDYARKELGGTITGPLGEAIAGRLAIRYMDRDGYGYDQLGSRDIGARHDLASRGKLRFELSPRLSLLVTADYSSIDAGGDPIEVLNATVPAVFNTRLTSLYGSTATTADPHDQRVNQDHRDQLDDRQGGAAFDFGYGFDNGARLRSLSAWRQWRADVLESALRLPGDVLPRRTQYDNQTISQELQWLSPGGQRFDWVAGLFLYREDYDIDQAFDAGAQFCQPTVAALLGANQGQQCLGYPQQRIAYSDFHQQLQSAAVFGQGTWRLAEQWSATLGLRWTADRKRADFAQVVANPFAALIRAAEATPDLRRDDARATWFANLSWHPAPGTMLFGTVSSGYKSGGFNPEGTREALGAQRRTFGPEAATNYELGVKSLLPGGRVIANVTAYRTDLEDFQDRAFDGVSFNVLNVGKVRQQGIEADIRGALLRPLQVGLGVGYLDSEYRSFRGAPPLPGNTLPQDLTGARKTNSPRWQVAADADWTMRLAGSVDWFVGGSWQYVDAQNIGLISNNDPDAVQPAHALVNARAGVRSATGRWELAAFGNNLTDKGYCLAIGEQPLGLQLGALDAANHSIVQRCILGAPRTWGARLRWRF